MDTIEDQDNLIFDDRIGAQCDIIRRSLNEIADDIGMPMPDVCLTFPV